MNKYSVHNYLQQRLMKQCQELPHAFDSVNDFECYKKKLRERLCEILPVLPSAYEGTGTVIGRNQLSEDLTLESIELTLDENLLVPVHLYKKEGTMNAPAVIICPGYGTPMNTDYYVSFAMSLANEGIAAAVIEYGGTGETAERPDYNTAIDNISSACHLLGMNEAGIRVSSNIALFNYLKRRKDINEQRIGITGLCQGSIITAYTIAVENGFYACAPLCGATTYEAEVVSYASRQGGWSGISPFVFDILKYADFQHLFSCFAPKPMLIQNNMTDIHWPLSGFEKVKQMVEEVYHLYKEKDKIQFRLSHAPHAYQGAHADNIIRFFVKQFL
ncbi:MAG: dienelactone hydrolase family protein [Clostridia bacterium]|nr:dienelactone hydrolase family protein [Clostridia bacterium]